MDAAARQFSEAYDGGVAPMEFVNSMRRQHKLIMGIGHRVKSVGAESVGIQTNMVWTGNRQAERHTDRYTDRHTNTHRQTHRQTLVVHTHSVHQVF